MASDLPAAAVQAAAEAIERELLSGRVHSMAAESDEALARAALEAAAPHLAAAERGRLAAWLAVKAGVDQWITEAMARTTELEAALRELLGDKAVWAAVMAGPKLGEDADDPRVVRRMLEAARKAVLDGGRPWLTPPPSRRASRSPSPTSTPGETSTETIWDDYVTVCAGSCYIDGIQAHANGTHVLTVKGRKTL